MHLDDGFADERGPKERPEGNEEVTAGDAGQIKQGVRDLHAQTNTKSTHSLPHKLHYKSLNPL
jgi:hypothetical protein